MPELTAKTKAALLERDNAKRAELYKELQKTVLETGPFVMIFQQTEVAGAARQPSRATSSGRPSTPTSWRGVTKN